MKKMNIDTTEEVREDGFRIGHRARLYEDGPWGVISRIEYSEQTLLTLEFSLGSNPNKGFCEVQVASCEIVQIAPPRYEIRSLQSDEVRYATNNAPAAALMLDELDALEGEPVALYDTETGERTASFRGLAYLEKTAAKPVASKGMVL